MRRILREQIVRNFSSDDGFPSNKAVLDVFLFFYLQVMQPVRWRLLVERVESLPVSLMIASVLSAVLNLTETLRLFCHWVNQTQYGYQRFHG